jgi:hypothetical protein
MSETAYCFTCKRDVFPGASIGANMQPERVCPGCAGVLPQLAVNGVSGSNHVASLGIDSPPDAPIVVKMPGKPVVGASGTSVTIHAPTADNLAGLVRDRKKFLKARIKQDQRELADLERLTSRRARKKPATVTRIRSAT